MTPNISIIIPVYHVEKYIAMCLQSVANQTMTEGVECIIVDDCGEDKSISIAKDFIDNYKGAIDFKIVYRETNGGLSAARNTGIAISKGEYLYFLDSDDELLPECLQQMWMLVEKYGKVDMVQGMFTQSVEPNKKWSDYDLPEFTKNRKKIKNFLLTFRGDIIPAQTKMVKRKLLLNNNLWFKEGIIHEDNYWTFFLSKYVKSLAYCCRRNYFHRYNPESITHAINLDQEANAYYVIIRDLCMNIDPYLSGRQKEYILENFITSIRNKFYTKETNMQMLFLNFYNINNCIQQYFLRNIFKNKANGIRMLIRLYRIEDIMS